jgi:homoserine O-acetyltransferase
LSAEVFRKEEWRSAGFRSVDDLVQRLFEDDYGRFEAADLLCQLAKWRRADVSRHAAGDLGAALGSISARTVVAAFSHDAWFPVADCEAEQRLVPHSEFGVVESLWGHYAWGMTPAETAQIESLLRDLLAT